MKDNEFWGDDAKNDIAPVVESDYENATGKSCVRWYDEDRVLHETLEDRPSTFGTRGYTTDFENWGMRKTEEAMRNGKRGYDEIVAYVRDHADDSEFTVTLTKTEIDTLQTALMGAQLRTDTPENLTDKFARLYDMFDNVLRGC